MFTSEEGGFVGVFGNDGEPRAGMFANDNGGRIDVFGKGNNKTRATVGVLPNGDGTVVTSDKNGNVVAYLYRK